MIALGGTIVATSKPNMYLYERANLEWCLIWSTADATKPISKHICNGGLYKPVIHQRYMY